MKNIINAIKNQKYSRNKLAEWKGKTITKEDMLAIAQGLLDSHIALRLRDGYTRTEAIETMSRFSAVWQDNMDKKGKVKIDDVRQFLTTYCGFVIEDKISETKDTEGNLFSVRSMVVR